MLVPEAVLPEYNGAMVKLIALFKPPADRAAFDTRWSGEFVPLAERMPGIRRITVSHVQASPAGPAPYALIHEFFFDTFDDLQSALASPEGQAAGRNLMAFAADTAQLLFAEHQEEERAAGAA